MKKIVSVSMTSLFAVAILLTTASCDWSSSGSSGSFNTSQGAGININFSGFYNGELSGGKAVEKTSNGNILSFTISQTGNRITVVDNQGSKYSGSVGAPGLVSQPSGGTYPSGAELVQGQINFSGKDGVSAKDIEFVGIVHVVSVTDIQGTTKTDTSGSTSSSSSSSESSSDNAVESTRTVNDGTNTTVETTLTIGVPGDPFYQVTTTTIVYDNQTGRQISRNVSTTSGSSSSSGSDNSSETVSTTEFSITEANSQYRIEGTWIEQDGGTSRVKARSAGTSGLIVTTATTTTTP